MSEKEKQRNVAFRAFWDEYDYQADTHFCFESGFNTAWELQQKVIDELVVSIDCTYCETCAERDGIFKHLEEG